MRVGEDGQAGSHQKEDDCSKSLVSGPDWTSELAGLTWEGVCGDVRVGEDRQAGSPQ